MDRAALFFFFSKKKGHIRFYALELDENKSAVSMILGSG